MSNIYEKYGKAFIDSNLMGPNVMMLAEELCKRLDLRSGMKVFDLGCGKALSSIFLAKEYGVTVFATDLWIPASENFERVQAMHLEHLVYPIHAEAHALPYANGFFDAIVSFDAYHYFGTDERYLNDHLVKLVKRGGQIGIAIPGFSRELSAQELRQREAHCCPDDLLGFHSKDWWQSLWDRIEAVEDVRTFDLACNREAWEDWINCPDPIGQEDKAFFENVKELVTVGLTARRS
ncbi:MAG: methyltransferase domain-containing protein [Clostridia bacterium]|nr:methyltransferase domain-containing protein [Clostridia bacterium]